MRVAFGTDESLAVAGYVRRWLESNGHQVVVSIEDEPWPDVAQRVGNAVASGEADRGVVCCWTGTGVSIAANKVPGVRAALCGDGETARGARRWNDANVMAISLRLTSPPLAEELLDAFFGAEADPDEADTIARVEPS